MKAPPRLYVDEPLASGQSIALAREAAHYLGHVMRRRIGDKVRLFNGRDGEWLARIMTTGRNAMQVRLEAQTRAFAPVPDIWLLFAPVKKTRSAFITEKATELGACAMGQVITARTTARPLHADRMARIAIEAAEQTERLDVPSLLPAQKLAETLQNWDANRLLIYCDEAGDDMAQPWGGASGRARPMLEALQGLGKAGEKAALLIGPEGGFSTEERAHLRRLEFVCPVSLGPRILRADSAAIAALSLWQAVCGDWRHGTLSH